MRGIANSGNAVGTVSVMRESSISLGALSTYLVLIPYLHPRGFDEFSQAYKAFFTYWLYVAMIAIIVYLSFCLFRDGHLRDESIHKRSILFIYLYLVLNIVLTFIAQGSFNEGLQELFAWPFLFIYLITSMRRDESLTLRAIENVMLLLFSLELVFNSLDPFSSSSRITFLGHVQVISQYAITAMATTAILIHKDGYVSVKRAALLLLVALTCIINDADTAKIVLLISLVGLVLFRFRVEDVDRKKLTVAAVFVLAITLLLIVLCLNPWLGLELMEGLASLLGDFNGRFGIWRSAMRLVYQTPFIGYGVQGAGITVEWSAGSMNYAHSQWMQNLLDGGIILSASFVLMILSLLVLVNSIEDNAIFYILSIMLINYLVIMIVDSVSYYPFFILLTAVIVHYSETQRRNQVLTNIR